MWRYSLALVAGVMAVAPASAATWADSMFDELRKDFGSVPQGQLQVHRFRLRNNTKGNVQISSLRVSCGCVSATVLKSFLAPGEETTVQANMDTSRFIGPRTVTIFVQFTSPGFEEARLWVSANSRKDFQLSPDTLAFGQVKRGLGASSSATVTFWGGRDARITKVRAESNYIEPVIVETRRLDHEVVYTVTAKLRPDTPVGKWYTDVWLETTAFGMPQLRVPLTVEVESPLTVNPPQVALGDLKVGEETERKIIVRGAEPFKITSVQGIDDAVQVKHDSDAREVHIVSVKVKPGKAGKLDRSLKITTSLKADNVVDFRIEADGKP